MDPARAERARNRGWIPAVLVAACLAGLLGIPWLPCPSCEWRTVRVPEDVRRGEAIPLVKGSCIPYRLTGCDVCGDRKRVNVLRGRTWRPPEPFSGTPSGRAR